MLGILGGTFNPIHHGHLSIAHDVLKYFHLSSVHLLPCHTPVHKGLANITTGQRISMLQLALQNKQNVQLDLTEIERGGLSYMVDTLKTLSINYPEALLLILGSDAFNGLHTWKKAQQILDYCHIVVCRRPNEVFLQAEFNDAIVADKNELLNKHHGRIYFFSLNPVACSSTFIRENIANNQLISQCLAQPVLEFIRLNKLYELDKN